MELRDLLFGDEFKNDLYLEFEVENYKILTFDHDQDFILITNLDPMRYGKNYFDVYTKTRYQIHFDDEKNVRFEHKIENVCTSVMLMEANFESFCAYMLFRKENKFLVYFDDVLLYESNIWKYFSKRLKQRYNNSLIRVVKYIYKSTLPLNIRISNNKEYFNKRASLELLKTLVDNDVIPTNWKPHKRYHMELLNFLEHYTGKGIYTLFRWIESFVDFNKIRKPLILKITPKLLEYILVHHPQFHVYWYCNHFPGAAKLIHYYCGEHFVDYLLNTCLKIFCPQPFSYREELFWYEVKEIVGPTKRVVINKFLPGMIHKYMYLINAGLCEDSLYRMCMKDSPSYVFAHLEFNKYTIKYYRGWKTLLTLFCCLKRMKMYDLRFIIGQYFLK